MSWTVPGQEWKGETAFILAGGETLLQLDPEMIKGVGPVIAIKDAGLEGIAPWADVLYWADKFWCDGNNRCDPRGDRLHEHVGKYKICRTTCAKTHGHDVKLIEHDRQADFSRDPKKIAGVDSGSNALNLAWLFGARRIILLGFDMRGKNWDGRPRRQHHDNTYAQRFMPSLARMVTPLLESGTKVINCSPNTALACFPIKTLEEVVGRKPISTVIDEPDGLAQPEDLLGDADLDAVEAAQDAQESDQGESATPTPESKPKRTRRAAAPDKHDPPQIVGLEMYAGPQLRRQLAKLQKVDHCFVTVRLRGADVITSRSRDWWIKQLGLVFKTISATPGEHDGVRFECHRERV